MARARRARALRVPSGHPPLRRICVTPGDVVRFDQYQQKWRPLQPFVFVGHVARPDRARIRISAGIEDRADCLPKCRPLLRSARASPWPVAFVRSAARAAAMRTCYPAGSRWIEGFEPKRAGARSSTARGFPATRTTSIRPARWMQAEAASSCWRLLGRERVPDDADRRGAATITSSASSRDASATRRCRAWTRRRAQRRASVLAVSGRYAAVVTAGIGSMLWI